MPSVPKLATLAHVYQRPIQEFVDLYELENLKALVPNQEGDFQHFRKLGIEYGAQGDHRRSAAAMLRGLCAARASGDVDAIAQALTSVGVGLHRLALFNAALRFHEEALRTVRDDRIRAYALHGMAIAYYHLGNFMLADYLGEKAAEHTQPGQLLWAHIRDLQASIFEARGRFDDAVERGREVLREYENLGDHQNATLSMSTLGSYLVRAGKGGDGLTIAREAMARAAELGDPRLRAYSAFVYGRCLYWLGDTQTPSDPSSPPIWLQRTGRCISACSMRLSTSGS
jgi:tetratricopeptide (TPR) repeat protein